MWLGALVSQDPASMIAASTGAATALGSLQLVTDEIVTSRGGTDQTQVTGNSLTASQIGPGAVSFAGSVELTSTVTGPTASVPTHDVINGPLQVVDQGGMWRVSTFTFDGQPLVYYPQGVQDSADGVILTVGFVLANANATVALVGLHAASSSTTIDVESVVLTLADGTSEQGTANFGRGVPAGEVAFKRMTEAPSHFDMIIRTSSGSTADLSVGLHGVPS